MSLAILFHFLCAQHVSGINISIIKSLRLCWWITTSVVLFSVRCVLELLVRAVFGGVRFAGWTTDVVVHQHSRKLLKMDILMSETCWAHNKWNKIASVIKLVFLSFVNYRIAMSVGPNWVAAHVCSWSWNRSVFEMLRSFEILYSFGNNRRSLKSGNHTSKVLYTCIVFPFMPALIKIDYLT